MPTRSKRGKKKPLQVKCRRCKGATCDQLCGKKVTCDVCKTKLTEGERVFTCKNRRCNFDKCYYCAAREKRPVIVASEDEDEDEEEEIEDDPRGEAYDSVPKKKNNETDQERRTREKAEITASQKQRIINAKTNGLPPIFAEDKVTEFTKKGFYPLVDSISSATLGGICTPFINDDGNGAKVYEAADVNAADPSGVRCSFRRFQRVFLKDTALPDDYKGKAHFVVQWVMVRVTDGKLADTVVLWISQWEHVTKGSCGVANLAWPLLPSDIQTTELWIHPFNAENTHFVAHSRRGWSLAMQKWLKENRPAVVEKPAEKEPPPDVPEVVPLDGKNLRTVAAVAEAELAEKRKKDKIDRVGRQFHFRNSETGKSLRLQAALKKQQQEDAAKLKRYDEIVAELTDITAEKKSLRSHSFLPCLVTFCFLSMLFLMFCMCLDVW